MTGLGILTREIVWAVLHLATRPKIKSLFHTLSAMGDLVTSACYPQTRNEVHM